MNHNQVLTVVGVGVLASMTGFFIGRNWQADHAPYEATPSPADVSRDASGPAEGRRKGPIGAREVQPVDLSGLPSAEWVDLYSPTEAWNGYNLVLYERRLPMVVDMNGRVVHHWPEVRVRERVRLDSEGHLLYVSTDNTLREVDWDGNLVWEYRPDQRQLRPHDDVRRLEGGDTLAIFRRGPRTDEIVRVDPGGEVVWSWSTKVLDQLDGVQVTRHPNLTSVQPIPAHSRAASDGRFQPGNLLVGAQALGLIFVVDQHSGEVVWSYQTDLVKQNDPTWIPDGLPGAGTILLVNHRDDDQRSRVLAVDPIDEVVTWSYEHALFASAYRASAQKLPNGNVLVTSSKGERVFEVSEDGTPVWQYAPPFPVVMASRYGYEHCPQLTALQPPDEVAVLDQLGPPHVDRPLYAFAGEEGMERVEIDGRPQQVLAAYPRCEEVVLPRDPTVGLGFGFPYGGPSPGATLRVELSRSRYDQAEVVFEGAPDAGAPWSEREFSLPTEYVATPVRLCVDRTPGSDGSLLVSTNLRISRGGAVAERQSLPRLEREVHKRRPATRQATEVGVEARGKRGRRRPSTEQ